VLQLKHITLMIMRFGGVPENYTKQEHHQIKCKSHTATGQHIILATESRNSNHLFLYTG
jgi:hypothetical protein